MATIDEKVVELKLDDKQFDKASDKTISKLEELKRSLNFDGAVKSFKEIDKAAKAVDLSPMEKGVQAVGNQFNALATIADAALRRITNNVMNWGERTLKSITIDPISSGWGKYEDKVGAVQTIMAATADQFEDTATQMSYVNEQLDKLNWFTDETSYHFLEMVQNIGKFTANQIPLEDSVTAMQGIATWAARSGANANEAGRAMYNLSQAISVGAVKLIDWKSIENANMSTAEFKKTAIETAEALGTLTKVGDGLYKTLAGHEVSIKNFNENLSDAWFSSEVLMKTLDRYGNFAVRLQELDDITDVGATGLIHMVDEYVAGTLEMDEAMKLTGLSAQELTEWLEELGSEENKLGRESLKAAQESKTFSDVLGYLTESVSTSWMNTFEHIFGNYEEAKELWSEVAESMYDVFVASGDMRNAVLRDWKALGGRTYLLDGVRKVMGNLWEVVTSLTDVFHDIFPSIDAEELVQLTYNFNKMAEAFKLNEASIESLQNVFRPFVQLLRGLWETVKVVIKAFEPVYILFNQLAGAALYLAGELGKLASSFLGITFSTDSLENLYTILNTIAKILTGSVYLAINLVIQGIAQLMTFVNNVRATFQQSEGGIRGFINAIIVNLQAVFRSIAAGEGIIGNAIGAIIGVASKLWDVIKNLFESITGGSFDSGKLGSIFSTMAQGVSDSGILDILGGIAVAMATIVKNVFDSVAALTDAESDLRQVIDAIIDAFRGLWDWLVTELNQMSMKDVADVALVMYLALLIQSFDNFSRGMDKTREAITKQINNIGGATTTLIKSLTGEVSTLTSITSNLSGLAKNTMFLQIAAAIYFMVQGLIKLSEIPVEDITRAALVIAGTSAAVYILMNTLAKLSGTSNNNNSNNGMEKAASVIIKFALAVGVLSAAVALLANYDLLSIGKGLLGLVGVLASLFAFLAAMHKFKIAGSGMKKIGLSILPVALGIAALAGTMAIFAQFDWEGLSKGLTAVFMLLGTIAGAIGIVGQFGGSAGEVLAAALAIDMIAAAVVVLAIPIAALSALDMDQLAQSMMIMSIQLAAVAGSIALLAHVGGSVGNILAAAAALMAVSAAVGVLALAIAGISALPMEAMWTAVAGLGVVVGGLVGLAALVGVFAPVAAGLTALSLALAALGMVILSVGASFMMFGIGVEKIAEGTAILVGLATGISLAAEQMGKDFPTMVEEGVNNVMLIIKAFLSKVPELTYEIARATVAVLTGILVGIAAIVPDLVKGLLWLTILILDAIASLAEPLCKAIEKVLDGLTAGVPGMLQAASKFIDALCKGLGEMFWDALVSVLQGLLNSVGLGFASDMLEKFHTWGDEAGKSYVDGIEKSIDVEAYRARQSAEDLGASVDEGVKMRANAQAGAEAAEDFGNGFTNQIGKKRREAFAISADLGNEAVEGLRSKEGIDAHSDSWKTILAGEDFIGGLLHTVEDFLPETFDMGSLLGTTLTNGLSSSLSEGLFDINSLLGGLFGRNQAPNKHDAASLDRSKLGIKNKTSLNLKKTATDSGDDVGTAFNDGLADALSSGKTSSGGSTASAAKEAVKTVAETVEETYKEELEQLEADAKTEDLQFNLWEALNVDVGEVEKKAKQIEYTNRKIAFQIERMRISGEKYEQILEGMGEDAIETKNAYNEWLQDQIDLEELQNEIIELQAETVDKFTELSDKVNNAMKQTEMGFKLWSNLNTDASDAQKHAAEVAQLESQISANVQLANIYAGQWKEAIDQFGQGSSEAISAQMTYLEQLNKVVETHNSLLEKQKESTGDQSENWRNYAKMYSAEMEKHKDPDQVSLFDLDFSEEEIAAYFREAAGIRDIINEEAADYSIDAMTQSAEELCRQYGLTVFTNMEELQPRFETMGTDRKSVV